MRVCEEGNHQLHILSWYIYLKNINNTTAAHIVAD